MFMGCAPGEISYPVIYSTNVTCVIHIHNVHRRNANNTVFTQWYAALVTMIYAF